MHEPPVEDLPNLVDADVVDEDLAPAADPTRPVRRRGLGIRLDALAAAAEHEAARADRAGHGITALLHPSPALAGRAAPRPASAAPASPSTDPRRDGRLLAEAQWLITPTSRVLHHHAPDRAGADQLLDDGWIEQDGAPVPLTLSCGRSAWTVVAPNALERHAMPRCEECCAALQMPDGVGSPVNDPACQRALTGRITAVAHPGGTP